MDPPAFCLWSPIWVRPRWLTGVPQSRFLGAGWRNRHSGRKQHLPLLRQSCGPHCPSAISDSEGAAQRRRHKNNQKKNRCPTDSCPHSKTNWAVGIKVRYRETILLQKRNRRNWFQGKDSVIDCLRLDHGPQLLGFKPLTSATRKEAFLHVSASLFYSAHWSKS